MNRMMKNIKEPMDKLKVNKSSRPDSLHPRVIKVMDLILEPLQTIFSCSLTSQPLPDSWRKANITVIYKKGDKCNPPNYKLVSLTCYAQNYVDNPFIRNKIIKHMKDNKQFSNSQHGFTSGKCPEYLN